MNSTELIAEYKVVWNGCIMMWSEEILELVLVFPYSMTLQGTQPDFRRSTGPPGPHHRSEKQTPLTESVTKSHQRQNSEVLWNFNIENVNINYIIYFCKYYIYCFSQTGPRKYTFVICHLGPALFLIQSTVDTLVMIKITIQCGVTYIVFLYLCKLSIVLR